MSRKNKTSSKPLKNIRVLVGRARHQASALSSKLRALGATVLEIPFIEIRKPKSFKPLDEALKKLNTLRLADPDQRERRRSHVGASDEASTAWTS